MIKLWCFILVVTVVGDNVDPFSLRVFDLHYEKRIPFPMPPICQFGIGKGNTMATTISLWSLDSHSYQPHGITYWDEVVETSCYSNFLGVPTETVEAITSQPPPDMPLETIQNLLTNMAVGETRDLNTNPLFDCRWMSTVKKETTRRWASKILVQYNSDGTLVGEGGIWLPEKAVGRYKNSWKKLFVTPFPKTHCPPLSGLHYPGIIKEMGADIFLTIPSRSLQFSIPHKSIDFFCIHESHRIYRTEDSFLVSFSRDNHTIEGSTVLEHQGFSSLASSWVGARMMYDLNHLETLVETELNSIENEVCKFKSLLWFMLLSNKSPDLIAQYHTGVPWSSSLRSNGSYQIYLPKSTNKTCTIPASREIQEGYLKVKCLNETVWIESISGRIKNNISRAPLLDSNWVTLKSGIYINYFSGDYYSPPGVPHHVLERFKGKQLPPLNTASVLNGPSSIRSHYSPSFNQLPSNIFESIVECISSIAFWTKCIIFSIILIIVIVLVKTINRALRPASKTRGELLLPP